MKKHLTRRDNWPALLELFLTEKRRQPFDWRTNNCFFFGSDWVTILTGFDPARRFRRRCTSALAAGRMLAKEGGLDELAERTFTAKGWPQVEPRTARRGDMATVGTPDGPALGVVIGASVACAGPKGVAMLPLSQARRAWRVE